MYQIFYVSNIVSDLNPEVVITDILDKALKYNPSKGLTGVLLYRSGLFLQLLEGDKAEVMKLLERIKKDQRHKNLFILLEQESEQRIYPEWSMAYKEVTDLDIKMVNEILSWNKLISASKKVDKHLIFHMLERFQTLIPKSKKTA